MTELEKFKRRMIRMVSRLQVQQKKPEDEMWEYLQKQTKCDCKWLWERMRALTIKRLKRLLIADDRHENIPAVARMSLTDWLLYDSILVHEKLDVIGLDSDMVGAPERQSLYDLLTLVDKFELEWLKGDKLAGSWTAATVHYNANGRQCSPMLLQRRWYQLKQVTREKFYKFWFSYRGNAKLLVNALKDKPTRLQSAIAKRYPHIITMPFMEWEERIEKRFIIMPQEFDIQMRAHYNTRHAITPLDDNDADLVILEPEIETIDLGVDSESENELRDEVEGSIATQMLAEDMSTVQCMTLKQEPIDEEDNVEDSINLDSTHMEAIDAEINHIEDIEALEKTKIPIEIDDTEKPNVLLKKKRGRRKKLPDTIEIQDEDIINHSDSMKYTDTEKDTSYGIEVNIASKEHESIMSESVILTPSTDDVIVSSTIDISWSPTIKPSKYDSKSCEEYSTLNIETSDVNRISLDSAITPKEEPTEVQEENVTDEYDNITDQLPQTTNVFENATGVLDANVKCEFDNNTNELPEMPQITNVFGNADKLEKLSSYLETTINNPPVTQKQDVENEIEEDIIKIEVVDSVHETEGVTLASEVDKKSEIKVSSENLPDNLFDDKILSRITSFDDDGIEFIDDGIVEEQEGESAMICDENEIKGVKTENKSNKENSLEESQSIDLKLLMVPVVYTKKLEQMNVLKNKSIFHVKGEDGIECIVTESRPAAEKSIQIKEESKPENKSASDDEEYAHDDLFDKPDHTSAHSSDSEDSIPEEKKVPLSSVLFKKPRNRDFGPLIICKNPDFNTRLKRLTAGFLSYSRNRFMLAACKPLTIDVCKAFESKLVNNTVYLKQSSESKCVVKQDNQNLREENRQSPSVVVQDNIARDIDAKITTSVQTLVDSLLENALPPSASKSISDVSVENENRSDVVEERNKVVVLPNIDNVRRINKKLLVAEVSPMRMENTNHVPPVSLVSGSMEKLNLPATEEKPVTDKPVVERHVTKRPEKETPSGTVICSGRVINNVTSWRRGYGKNKMPPWRPTETTRVSRGFWNTKKPKNNQPNRYDDQLLTVDTLNKMLIIVHDKDPISTHERVSYKKNLKDKQRQELLRKVNEIEKLLTGDNSRIDIDESKDTSNKMKQDETKPQLKLDLTKPKRGRPRGNKRKQEQDLVNGQHCCWIDLKKKHPRSMSTHPCENSCDCCCRKGIELETDPSIKKVCESIESVIRQSRDVEETEKNNAKEHSVNSDNDNTCSLDKSKLTENICSNVVAERNNVIDITDGDNDSTAIQGDDENNSIPNYDLQSNCVIVDSGVLRISNIEQNTRGKNDNIKHAENKSDANDVDAINSVKQDTVEANLTVTGETDQPPPVDQCVIIDCETTDIQNSQTPCVKINVSYQEQPLKRKRGRPPKVATPIFQEPQIIVKTTRLNRRSMRNKEKEVDNSTLFINSNHIRQPNQPIFLGKNKILLTDVPLPRNKVKPVEVENSPGLVNSSLPLPKGVNLMLLPNGVMTCIVDPNVQLTTDELTKLAVIIETIQKQISSVLPGLIDPATQLESLQVPSMQIDSPSQQLAPTIPTMAVPDITQSKDAVNILQDDKDAQKPIDDYSQSTTSPTESADNITNIDATENITPINIDSISVSAPKTNDDSCTKSDEIIQSTPMETDNASTIQSLAEQSNVSTPNDNSAIESDKDKQSLSAESSDNAVQDSNQVNRVESEPVNKKTILSDLMEMSGIFEEDIAPVPHIPQQPEVPQHHIVPVPHIPQQSEVQQNQINRIPHLPQQPELPLNNIASEYPIATPSLTCPPVAHPDTASSLTELTAIISFTEIKYACLQNGNFFKLDLVTRSLTPINVCIKKKFGSDTTLLPKQFVDLTCDADEEESIENDKKKQFENVKTYVVRKRKAQDKSSREELAKPLKLFKVVHPFGCDILQKDKSANSNEDTVYSSDIENRPKRSRKQNLREQAFEIPSLSFLTNEEEQEDYEFEGSFDDTVAPDEDSDSSDDEPLAKKVKRREEASRQVEVTKEGPLIIENEERVEPAAILVQDEIPSQDDNNELPLPAEQSDMPSTEVEKPVDELEEGALEPSEVEFLSDQDNEEDDCILGI